VSTKTRLDAEMAPFIKEAHNDYFAALVERGPIGLLGLLIFLAALATYSLTLVRGRLSDGFAAVISKPNALVGAVCGTMLASTVYELLHLRHLWALFAMVAAVSIWGRRAPD
jgi:O-antigen ligase